MYVGISLTDNRQLITDNYLIGDFDGNISRITAGSA